MKRIIKYFILCIGMVGFVSNGLATTACQDTGEIVFIQSKQDVTLSMPYGLFDAAMNSGGIEVSLFDSKGSVIEQQPCFSTSHTIDISSYPNLRSVEMKSAIFQERFTLD